MTYVMDKFFISIGFDAEEIHESPKRGGLYIGIVFMLGLASAFLLMTVIELN